MQDGEAAINLIRTLAFLNPDSITLQFVRRIELGSDIRLGLNLLQKFSMIQVVEGRVLVHRPVQEVVRVRLVSNEKVVIIPIVVVIETELRRGGESLKRECTT